ncbi:MbtH family NRPS accessory protein [Micromonospora sp. NPDC047644]|uniref:MbtH family protein n=1 Tax=Micromonospora sp. NPDC047644 TaxID=3157203 RepID=UPI003456F1B2
MPVQRFLVGSWDQAQSEEDVNILDNPDGRFFVVVNDEGQHSLWPESLSLPAGWTVAHGPADRASCLDHVTTAWTDMRPRSLVTHLESVAREVA